MGSLIKSVDFSSVDSTAHASIEALLNATTSLRGTYYHD